MCRSLLLVLLLSCLVFALPAQEATPSSTDPIWQQLDESLLQLEQMLNSTETELSSVKDELQTSKLLLQEARESLQGQSELYEKLLQRYEKCVTSYKHLERRSKILFGFVISEAGVIGVLLTILLW